MSQKKRNGCHEVKEKIMISKTMESDSKGKRQVRVGGKRMIMIHQKITTFLRKS